MLLNVTEEVIAISGLSKFKFKRNLRLQQSQVKPKWEVPEFT